jgi:hypothetical protein
MADGQVIKVEIDPSSGWVLVDGARDATVIHRFRLEEGQGVVGGKPNDGIRIRTTRRVDVIETFMDRERGGKWWGVSSYPRFFVKLCHAFGGLGHKSSIFVDAEGGDLASRVSFGSVDLYPAARQ